MTTRDREALRENPAVALAAEDAARPVAGQAREAARLARQRSGTSANGEPINVSTGELWCENLTRL